MTDREKRTLVAAVMFAGLGILIAAGSVYGYQHPSPGLDGGFAVGCIFIALGLGMCMGVVSAKGDT